MKEGQISSVNGSSESISYWMKLNPKKRRRRGMQQKESIGFFAFFWGGFNLPLEVFSSDDDDDDDDDDEVEEEEKIQRVHTS